MQSFYYICAAFGAGFFAFTLFQIVQRIYYLHPNSKIIKFISYLFILPMIICATSLLIYAAFSLFKKWDKSNSQAQEMLSAKESQAKYEAYRSGKYKPTYDELNQWLKK